MNILRLNQFSNPDSSGSISFTGDYSQLVPVLKKYELRENTISSYHSDLRDLENYLESRYIPFDPNIGVEQLEGYLIFLAVEKGFKINTIKRRKAAINAWFKKNGRDAHSFKAVIKSISNILSSNNVFEQIHTCKAQPLSWEVLFSCCTKLLETKKEIDLRNNAIIQIMIAGALRVSEVINLKRSNIINLSEKGFDLELYKSKNQAVHETGRKHIPMGGNGILSPGRALLNYINVSEIEDDEYLFNSYTRGGKHKVNSPLSTMDINRIIKNCLGNEYSSHSMRTTFITESFNKGSSMAQVQKQTQHKSVNSVMGYYRDSQTSRNNSVTLLFPNSND